MNRYKHPIEKSILLRSFLFFLVLIAALVSLEWYTMRRTLYRQYETDLTDIIGYVCSNMDLDDLKACSESGIPSEKYAETQQFLNRVINYFEFDYIYTVIPTDEAMINVISATSAEEFAAGELDMPLGEVTYAYSPEQLWEFRRRWDEKEICFFEEYSDYGRFYTACLPLRSSDGETFALLCADVSSEELHQAIQQSIFTAALLIFLFSAVFWLIMVIWTRRNITGPITRLEEQARSFAEKRLGNAQLSDFIYEAPDIRTDNEIQSLSNAITKMADDTLRYVRDALSSQSRLHRAEDEAVSMSVVAYKDALTGVKNKAAFETKRRELDGAIRDGHAEFALVMVDLNHLKQINDSCGHEKGDLYIQGACRMLCEEYKHSPVYRVGGDEFVAVLEAEDYKFRENLLTHLRLRFQESASDLSCQPWERYSAACGMALFRQGDADVSQVFVRADEAMYREKEKSGRQRRTEAP